MFSGAFAQPASGIDGDKRLRPNFTLCENRAGMAQPGKALDCYPDPAGVEADIQCSKELGGSNPPPRAAFRILQQMIMSGKCTLLDWRAGEDVRGTAD